MSPTVRMWIKTIFNVGYLLVVWGLVVMWRQRAQVSPSERRVAALVTAAFALLALGDTGHVGFRVAAFALGNLEANVNGLGTSISLIGAGTLATAITVTRFYVVMQEGWRTRFNQRQGWFEYLLLASVVVRFAMMIPPVNEWHRLDPPYPWGIYRNVPLAFQGVGVAYLFFCAMCSPCAPSS